MTSFKSEHCEDVRSDKASAEPLCTLINLALPQLGDGASDKPRVCNGIIPPGNSGMMPPPCKGMIPPGAGSSWLMVLSRLFSGATFISTAGCEQGVWRLN